MALKKKKKKKKMRINGSSPAKAKNTGGEKQGAPMSPTPTTQPLPERHLGLETGSANPQTSPKLAFPGPGGPATIPPPKDNRCRWVDSVLQGCPPYHLSRGWPMAQPRQHP